MYLCVYHRLYIHMYMYAYIKRGGAEREVSLTNIIIYHFFRGMKAFSLPNP